MFVDLVFGMSFLTPWSPVSFCIYFFIYLFVYGFATFVINEVTGHKTNRNEQVTQQPNLHACRWFDQVIRFVVTQHGSSRETTMYLESSFPIMFSKEYVLQMFENVI